MKCHALLGVLTAAILVVGLSAPGIASAGNVADCPGIFYDGPTTGTIEHSPATVTVGHQAYLKIVSQGGEFVAGSATFEIDGPAGHESIPASNQAADARWTPRRVGHYIIAAKWRQYRCRDASAPTYADGSAPGVGVDVVGPKSPTAFFKTSRLPRTRNSLGSASIVGGVRCPGLATASNERIVITLYWATGGAAPTHASRHVRSTMPNGCYGRGNSPPLNRPGQGFHAAASGQSAQVNVFAPTRLRVLIEVQLAGRLLDSRRVRFAPTANGESVVRG
jgi:hypothetical protein